jgi:hypothetical protein
MPDATNGNVVTGRVVLGQTVSGLADLLVVLYDVDGQVDVNDILARLFSGASDTNGNGLGRIDRIASVLTGPDGSFTAAFDDREYRVNNDTENRPDLQLLVLAPEAANKTGKELLLHASEIRRNAARKESWLIRLTSEQLQKAGVPLPEDPPVPKDENGETDLAALETKLKASKQFFDRKAALLKQHVEAEHEVHAARRESEFSVNVKEELSTIPKDIRTGKFFVADNESIKQKVLTNTRETIRTNFNEPPPEKTATAAGFIYLTEAQIASYQQFRQGDDYVLPSELVKREILPAVYRRTPEGGGANDFVMSHPAVRACLRKNRGELACEPEPPGQEDPPPDSPVLLETEDPPPAEPGDERLYVARQMQHVSPPEGVVNFGVDNRKRPSADELGEHIANLRFEKGPADTPALFDFHTLKIAFEHVWKEATDLGILANGEALYDEVVGVGQRPTSLKNLLFQVGSITRFLKQEPQKEQPIPPVEVIFEFPDAVDLWGKMSTNERQALLKIAVVMLGKYRDVGDGNTIWLDYLHAGNVRPPYIDKGHLLDRNAFEVIGAFRQKGQRILDTVYERVQNAGELSSEFERYRKAEELANALNQQLQQKYSFTYFAANATERSVELWCAADLPAEVGSDWLPGRRTGAQRAPGP